MDPDRIIELIAALASLAQTVADATQRTVRIEIGWPQRQTVIADPTAQDEAHEVCLLCLMGVDH